MPNFTNMLPWWGWTLMLAVPIAIIALYFLKLKRQPVEVPSTYLWLKSIEDLHVNSLWQKLRQSLLLFLQLLLLLFAILALLRPSWSGTTEIGNRSIFLIDISASMGATDVDPDPSDEVAITRLDEVKRQVGAMIDQMESTDKAMIITFADEARVVHPYTDSRNALRKALEKIRVTQKPTSMLEALRVAAGLANPGQTASDPRDVPVADALEATLYIFTDGNFAPPDFSLGNLEPKYMKIGEEDPDNVAVAAFSVEHHEERPQEMQAFARLENYGPEDAVVRADLYLGETPLDVKEIEVPAGESNGVVFTMDSVDRGVLKLVINARDDLSVDNTAWAARNPPRQALALVVTAGNEPLELCLQTQRAMQRMLLQFKEPAYLQTEEYRDHSLSGVYDFIIFDNCLPAAKEDNDKTPTPMPLANTWFIGTVPKLPAWGWEPGKPWPPQKKDVPLVLDVERAHPIMDYVAMGNVRFGAGIPLGKPSGGTTLIDTDEGEILSIAPREGFEDLVLGVDLVAEEPETNWPLKLSFPVFVLNVTQYLGGIRESVAARSIRPGEAVELRPETTKEKLNVVTPDGQEHDISRNRQNTFLFSHADTVGAYQVRDGDDVLQTFTANLFDSQESNLKPAKAITTTWNRVGIQPEQTVEPTRREAWKWLLLLALAVCLFEWYIYNRRVYL